jgi:hypothetical protein
VRRCAWTRGRRHERDGKAGLTGEGEFGRRPLQVCGAPSSDSTAARRWTRGEAKGEGGGGAGVFIGMAGEETGRGNKSNWRGDLIREDSVTGVNSGRRRKTTGNRGPPVSEGKRDAGVPVRGRLEWAAGCFSCWAEGFPGVCFIFFSFPFFFFYFLVSFISFANLVQIASNQLCKVSKIQNNNPEQ